MIRRPDKPLDERGGMDWLGPEFLTWLWWRAGVEPEFVEKTLGGRVGRGDPASLYVHVDEFLELRGERAAARKTSLRAGMPGASAEGKVALRHGKVVTAARLLFARGEEETSLTLKAEDLDLSSVKLPGIDSADSSAPGQPVRDLEGHGRVDDPRTPNTGAGDPPYADRGAFEFQPR